MSIRGWRAVLPMGFSLVLGGLVPAHSQDNADAEPNCVDPQTQLDMNFCAYRDFEKADKELNEVWKIAKARVAEFESYLPADQKGGSDLLLNAQRLWIKFRDTHCETAAYSWTGGSGYPLIYHSCRADVTKARVKQLLEIAEEK